MKMMKMMKKKKKKITLKQKKITLKLSKNKVNFISLNNWKRQIKMK